MKPATKKQWMLNYIYHPKIRRYFLSTQTLICRRYNLSFRDLEHVIFVKIKWSVLQYTTYYGQGQNVPGFFFVKIAKKMNLLNWLRIIIYTYEFEFYFLEKPTNFEMKKLVTDLEMSSDCIYANLKLVWQINFPLQCQ